MNMKPITSFLFLVLLLIASFPSATRPGCTASSPSDQPNRSRSHHRNNKDIDNNYGDGGAARGFFGPGGGFNIPGLGNGFGNGIVGGGYGAGYGGPNGGYSKGGVIRPTVVCKEKGPCYQKKVTCPARCFTSFSRNGKGYGGGGGGGSCTIDCKKKCTAYC